MYICLGFIMLKGIVGLVKSTPMEAIQAQQEQFLSDMNNDSAKNMQVAAFAESFIKSYSTYETGKENEYKKSLETYATDETVKQITSNFKIVDEAMVKYVKAVDIESINDNQFDVTVEADIIYTKYPKANEISSIVPPANSENGETQISSPPASQGISLNPFVQTKTVYYIVPVFFKDGRCAIEGSPFITAPPGQAQKERETIGGMPKASSELLPAIEQLITDFTKSIFTDGQSKINYYLDDPNNNYKFRAFGSSVTLLNVSSIDVYDAGAGTGVYYANVAVEVQDANGSKFVQTFFLEIIKKDRYLIKDIGLRQIR